MEEKKNIHCKFIYKCAICGTEYSDILSRAHCELACAARAEEEAKKVEEEKRLAERDLRKEAVDEAFENLHRLITEFVKDYGHYEYGDGGEDTNFCWPSRLWHNFWN